jgi:hypothetical protein
VLYLILDKKELNSKLINIACLESQKALLVILYKNKMILSTKHDYEQISLHFFIYPSNVFVNMSTKEDKINETNTNRTKFNTNNTNTSTNFNERTNIDYNNTLNQQQDAINKTLDNTLHNVKRTTDEATREIPRYTQRIAEYQEQTIQTIKNIASDFIEAQKEAIGSFQSQIDRNSGGVWDVYNPQRIAENHAVMVNNFTSYLLNTSNLINNALASNMRVYNTALEQTRDNLKNFAQTNTNFVQSVNRQNSRKF